MTAISILLPTRKRAEMLARSVESMYRLAARPDDIELLLRVDDDDPTDYGSYVGRANATVIRGPRWGYRNMHRYYDQLSSASSGRWLFIWNDDTYMLTPRWDELLLSLDGQMRVQFPKRDILAKCDTTFPVFPKTLHEVMGSLAENCHVDSWLDAVSYEVGILTYRDDIVFHHDRPEDEVANERVYAWEEFQANDMRSARADAVARLRRYLEEHPEARPR